MLVVKMVAYANHIRFEWSGGPYIDVYAKNQETPHDVINVWNYELDLPRIEYTPEAFEQVCLEWLREPVDLSDIR